MKLDNLNEFVNNSKVDESTVHDYGCVMGFFPTGKYWDSITNIVKKEDLYLDKDDDSYGLEDEPHITLLYGLHSDIPDSDVEDIVKEFKAPTLILNEISVFENENFDVLKFDVHHDALIDMNKKLTTLPYTTDYPNYKAHTTIAYVKPGLGKKYAIKIDGIEVIPEKIVYSKVDGSKIIYKFKK